MASSNTQNAQLYQTDRGVKILVLEDSKNFFQIGDIPFNEIIDNRITKVSMLKGDVKSLMVAARPDVVVAKYPEGGTKKDIVDGANEIIVDSLNDSDEKIAGSVTLSELYGHVFFVIYSNGEECTYSQYLFIDQLRSLKAKLNID